VQRGLSEKRERGEHTDTKRKTKIAISNLEKKKKKTKQNNKTKKQKKVCKTTLQKRE